MSMYKNVKVFLIHCDCGGAIGGPFKLLPLFETRIDAESFLNDTLTELDTNENHKPVITEVSMLVPNYIFGDTHG